MMSDEKNRKERNRLMRFQVFTAALLSALLFAGCGSSVKATSSVKPLETSVSAAMGITETKQNQEAAKNAGFGVLDSFSTTDLNGNKVTQDIFKAYKLTMVNVWGTFCGPCINEMPGLGKLHAEYQNKGVQVVGIPLDVLSGNNTISTSRVETAKEIVSTTKADYPHLLPQNQLAKLASQVMVYPTTIFVDSNGNQVGKAYTGARSEETWAKIIDENLTKVQ